MWHATPPSHDNTIAYTCDRHIGRSLSPDHYATTEFTSSSINSLSGWRHNSATANTDGADWDACQPNSSSTVTNHTPTATAATPENNRSGTVWQLAHTWGSVDLYL